MRYDVRHAETDRLDATGVDEHSADAYASLADHETRIIPTTN